MTRTAWGSTGRLPLVTMTKCRSGCPTKDHKSYSACLRAGAPQLSIGVDKTFKQKAWDNELSEYRKARAQGIQPDGTTLHKVRKAVEISNATGVAYRGTGVE